MQLQVETQIYKKHATRDDIADAGTKATHYLTLVDEDYGIQVHGQYDPKDTDDIATSERKRIMRGNYVQINSDDISMWRNYKEKMALNDTTLEFYYYDDNDVDNIQHTLASYGEEINIYKIGTKLGDNGREADDKPVVTINQNGASFAGAITASSLTIQEGEDVYNGIAALNIAGYTIEITTSTEGVADIEHDIFLYPHLYHNGIEVEYFLSTDTERDVSKTYYTRSGTAGNYTYTIVSNPPEGVNPSEQHYYESIDYSHFIWYQDSDITGIGTPGDANNQGRYPATYGDSYRVIYEFEDGEVGGASEVQTRIVDPQKYITRINDYGITIHPEKWTNQSSYIQLDGSGMELFNSSGNSIAQYGSTIRIGADGASRVTIDTNGLTVYKGSDNVAEFGLTTRIGSITGARVITTSAGIDIFNNLNEKKASYGNTLYIYGGNGTYPLTSMDSSVIKIAQSANNFIQINSNGLQLYRGGSSLTNQIAQFGETIRIGKEAEGHIKVTSDGIELWGQSLGETEYTFIYSEGISVGINADSGGVGLGPGGYIKGYYNEIDDDVTENGIRIESNTVNEEEGSSTQALVSISASGADTAAMISAFIDDSIDNGDGTVGVSSISLEAESISLDGQVQCQEISSLDGTYKEILLGNYSSRAQEVNYALTTSSADNLWLTAALTAICEDYPNYDHTIFKGRLAPNSQGYFEIYIYDTDNTSNGLPQYSYGTWNKWQGTFWIISTNNYSFAYTAK